MAEKTPKPKKWKFTVELPCTTGCTEKIAKEKVAVAVASAFSIADSDDVKVKSEKKPVVKK